MYEPISRARCIAHANPRHEEALERGGAVATGQGTVSDQVDQSNRQARRAATLIQLFGKQDQSASRQPIQAKFAGTLGSLVAKLTPEAIGATDTYYKPLWTALNATDVEIAVEHGGAQTGYVPSQNTLRLNQNLVTGLFWHTNGKPLEKNVLADHVALITHELSHAHDSILLGKELSSEKGSGAGDAIANVLRTEALAWEREARTRMRLAGGREDAQDRLWEGWLELEADMLNSFDTLKQHKATNEVIGRYYRYLIREGGLHGIMEKSHFEAWFATHGTSIQALFGQLANSFRLAKDTIAI